MWHKLIFGPWGSAPKLMALGNTSRHHKSWLRGVWPCTVGQPRWYWHGWYLEATDLGSKVGATDLGIDLRAEIYGSDLGALICGSDLGAEICGSVLGVGIYGSDLGAMDLWLRPRSMDIGAELGFRNKFYCMNLLSFVPPPSRGFALHRSNYIMSKSVDIQNKQNSYSPNTLSNYIA
jgi:hypothetical protein